jgi:IS30 family transposase
MGNPGDSAMKSRKDNRLSEEQKAELWRQRHQGETIAGIGRRLGRYPATIRWILQKHGGIEPPRRTRSARVLSLTERETISRGLAQGHSQRSIARELGRAPSSISREIARNGGAEAYRAEGADRRAWHRALRPKPCKLVIHRRLWRVVIKKLEQAWSPKQIEGWLEVEFPDDKAMRVSAETIYRTLYVQSRGALKKELIKHLRMARPFRRAKRSGTERRGKIADAVSIRERPPEAEDRAVPGHWEGDLLAGSHHSFIATLVERHSRWVMLVKVDSKHTDVVVSALSKKIKKLPPALRRSLTWDRGKELSQHKQFTIDTKVQVYFCDPQSPWQRGSNENTNGLLRQYFPKGTDVSQYTQAQLDKVAKQLNERPRQTLGFRTPAFILNKIIQSSVAPID